jgi:cytochrome b6-f complex iron-sulfur subunit
MKRRNFLSWVGVGTLATSLPMVLAACNSASQNSAAEEAAPTASEEPAQPTSEEVEVANNTPAEGFVAVGTVADLDSQGFIANEDIEGGPVIVIRDPAAADSLIALDSRCPHRGCAVEWQATDTQFLCPCHQSIFEPDGNVVSGPATSGLEPLEARIEGDQVLVKTA